MFLFDCIRDRQNHLHHTKWIAPNKKLKYYKLIYNYLIKYLCIYNMLCSPENETRKEQNKKQQHQNGKSHS